MSAFWNWDYAWAVLPDLLGALRVTVGATLAGMALALTLGLGLALLRRSHRKMLSWPAAAFVEFVRNTPLLVQIFFLFYVLPRAGITLSPWLTGVLALGLHYSSYTSEVYRAGIESVGRGQWEAAQVLNLGQAQTFFRVILPQALPPVAPALGNYLVAMFKDTPLLSTITVLELLYTAKDLASESFRYLEPLTLVGLLFLGVSLLAAQGVRALEHRLRIGGAH
jgi:polar amino acid transport system permease protein